MGINATIIYTEKMIKEFIQFALFRAKHSKVIVMLLRILSPILLLVGTYIMLIRPFDRYTNDDSEAPSWPLFYALFLSCPKAGFRILEVHDWGYTTLCVFRERIPYRFPFRTNNEYF